MPLWRIAVPSYVQIEAECEDGLVLETRSGESQNIQARSKSPRKTEAGLGATRSPGTLSRARHTSMLESD